MTAVVPSTRSSRSGKRLRLAAVLGLFFVLGLAGVWRVGSAITAPHQREVGTGPTRAEDVHIASASGATLAGWWLPGRADRAEGKVVLLHPLGGDRRAMLGRAAFLSRAGYDTLLVDLQGHGESIGEAVTAGWHERLDAAAAIDFAKARTPAAKLAVIGWSLGGAATLLAHGESSIELAPDGGAGTDGANTEGAGTDRPNADAANAEALPPLAPHPTELPPGTLDAVVLESVYPVLDEAIENRIRMRLGPLAPVLTPLLTAQLPLRLDITADDVRPIDHVALLGCPVLVVSGTADTHTTEAETRTLFDAASEPKQLLLFEGADHTDLHAFDPETYEREVLAFLAGAFAD